MNAKHKRTYPAEGGSYSRQADGSLKQKEKSTAPPPGKTALRAAEAAKRSTGAAPVKKQEKGNG